jgi:hypothetical protein
MPLSTRGGMGGDVVEMADADWLAGGIPHLA